MQIPPLLPPVFSKGLRRKLWTVAVFVGVSAVLRALPVFPGAVGFGTDTVAGRRGKIYRVTNLEDSGPGSLRYGMENVTGARVIVFEVSGVIRLKSDLQVRSGAHGDYGRLTIAGQTAPGVGITLAGAGISVAAPDVLIQHIAVRPGDRLKPVDNRDCIKIDGYEGYPVHHVVVDHVSCSWAVDETVSTWSDKSSVFDVTFSNCIFAEPVINGGHSKGSHPYGPLGGRNSGRLSLVRNVMAFNMGRNPLIRDRTSGAQVVNNLIYRPGVWGNATIYVGDLTLPPHAVSVVGNVVIRQPLPFSLEQTGTDGVRARRDYIESDYRDTAIYVHDVVSPHAGLYLRDNRFFNPQTQTWLPEDGDPWNAKIFRDSPKNPVKRLERDPYVNAGGVEWQPWPANEVEARVLENVGKFPARRDAIDALLIEKIRGRTGEFLQDLSDRGEDPWAPADVVERRALVLPENPSDDDDGDGYTNLEEWLHELAAAVEGRATL